MVHVKKIDARKAGHPIMTRTRKAGRPGRESVAE